MQLEGQRSQNRSPTSSKPGRPEALDTCPIQRHNRHPEKSATTIALYRPGGRPFLKRSRGSTSFCPSSSFVRLWQLDDVGASRMDRASSISQDSSHLSSLRAPCFDENPGAYPRDKRRSHSRWQQLHELTRGEMMKKLTTAFGAPVDDNQNIATAGKRGRAATPLREHSKSVVSGIAAPMSSGIGLTAPILVDGRNNTLILQRSRAHRRVQTL